jgi:hypothetical protein
LFPTENIEGIKVNRIIMSKIQESDANIFNFPSDQFQRNFFCPICNSKSVSIDEVQTINSSYGNKFQLKECSFCHHWWIDPIPTQSYLSYLYSISSKFVVSHDYSNNCKVRGKDLNKLYKKIFSNKETPSDYNYLEIGIGSGDVFDYFQSITNISYGVEPGPWGSKHHNIVNDIKELPLNLKFNRIVIFDVLEHVQNPILMLKQVKMVAHCDVKLFCTFPNKDSVLAKCYKSKWRMIRPLGHLHFFSKESIKITLKKSGWYSTKIESSRQNGKSNFDFILDFFEIKSITSGKIINFPQEFLLGRDQWYIECNAIKND